MVGGRGGQIRAGELDPGDVGQQVRTEQLDIRAVVEALGHAEQPFVLDLCRGEVAAVDVVFGRIEAGVEGLVEHLSHVLAGRDLGKERLCCPVTGI